MVFDLAGELHSVPAGALLLRRGQPVTEVLHIEAGRVILGLIDPLACSVDATAMPIEHQLGRVDGPFWLDATAAVLGLPSAVDAVAATAVSVRRVPIAQFVACMGQMPPALHAVVHDIAQAHRLQADVSVSRLIKDAEARCAEWLLAHAENSADTIDGATVMLRERKRAVAAQLGIAPETLSRVLRHLRERGLIAGTGRLLTLVDPQGLRALAGA